MAFLTDRTLATGVTPNDLIHIVITGDTSQNPAGSSYKATMGQVIDLINPTTLTGGTYDSVTGSITFYDDTGGSFIVTGLVTGFSDTFVTAFTYNNANTFTITENDGSTFSATIDSITGITYYEATTGITTSATTLVSGYSYNGINYLGNVDLTLFSPNSLDGLKIIVKDEGGNAGSNRIRIAPSSGTIDGNSYIDMNINYMSLTFVARNNNWWLI
jgi:hypothetical protein